MKSHQHAPFDAGDCLMPECIAKELKDRQAICYNCRAGDHLRCSGGSVGTCICGHWRSRK